jgi:hypothetical protein
VSSEELRELAKLGRITFDTLIQKRDCDGTSSKWVLARDVQGLLDEASHRGNKLDLPAETGDDWLTRSEMANQLGEAVEEASALQKFEADCLGPILKLNGKPPLA